MNIHTIESQDDVRKVVSLFIKVFSEAPYGEEWTEELAEKRLMETFERGKGFCLYAEQDGKVVGMIFCQKQTWHDGVHLIVEDTVVDPSVRGAGVGSQLVKALEEKARSAGIVSIDLLTLHGCPAQRFWEKHGYVKSGYEQHRKVF